MYSRFQLAKKYLLYYWNAANGRGHGIHSPFVFAFTNMVLNDRKSYDDYQPIEVMRRKLLQNDAEIVVNDLGAGSVTSVSGKRRISAIARHAAKPAKYAQLLYRVVRYYKPGNVLELGTSLGLTTAYLATAAPESTVYSLEGAENITALAKDNLLKLSLGHVNLVTGNFDDQLEPVLRSIETIGLAFVDGNHRKDPTLAYFRQILQHLTPQSIIIFDDIHWSAEMEEAWESIKSDTAVTLTIDLFFIGLVFCRTDFIVKQHFSIRF